jgi:Ser/Thr protein kinase RdoA (MazF antagonist)
MTDISKLVIIASTDSYMIRDYTIDYVSELIETNYGLKGIMKELGSYTDKNFLLKVGEEGSNTKFIVKISSTLECPQAILLQNYVLRQLETHT